MNETKTETVILNPPETNPAVVYLSGLAPSGRRSMTIALDIAARELGYTNRWDVEWHTLTYAHITAIKANLTTRLAPATVNKILCAIRGTLTAAWKLGLMETEVYQTAVSVKQVKGTTEPAGRAITLDELIALLNTCDASPLGVRDAAIITVLYITGMRRTELVSLDLDDYNDGALLVRGKGNKERKCYLNTDATDAMTTWLVVRGDRPGALFTRTTGRVLYQRLTSQSVYNMLQTRCRRCGIRPFAPHSLRRTVIGDLLSNGVDISTVSRMMGHASVVTTARYDRRPEDQKRVADNLLHLHK